MDVDVATKEGELTNNRVLSDDSNLIDSIKVETALYYSSHSEQQSAAENILDSNENTMKKYMFQVKVEDDDHLKSSVTENTYPQAQSTTKLKLAAKLRERQLKCQTLQNNGSKLKTATRQRRRGNSKKNSHPKQGSRTASADDKESDTENSFIHVSAIKHNTPIWKTVKSPKQKPNWSYFEKESAHCNICQYTFKLRGKYERYLADDKCRHDCKFCGKVFLAGQT